MIQTLLEGNVDSLENWLRKLDCDREPFETLVAKGVFQRRRIGYRLHFVGLFLVGQSACYCRPVLEDSGTGDLLVEIEKVDRLLRAYEARSKHRDIRSEEVDSHLFNDADAQRSIRHLDILSALLEWTESYGFHKANETSRITGSYRRVDWAATVSSQLAIPTRTGVIYSDQIAIHANSFLSPLGIAQAHTLLALYDNYREVATVAFADANETLIDAREIVESNPFDLTTAENHLWEQLAATNIDHVKDLIHLLLAYYRQDEQLSGMIPIRLYGTSAFYLVWEDICRSAIGDDAPLGGSMSNAGYRIDGKFSFVSPQRPDTMWTAADGSTYIVDAKYYPRFPKFAPSIEDIRKQLFYGLSISTDSTVLAFLFPGRSNSEVEYSGEARMAWPTEDDDRFEPVHCITLDWGRLSDAYVARSQIAGLREKIASIITEHTA